MDTDQLLRENPAFSSWWWLARAYHTVAADLTRYLEEHGLTGPQFGVIRCLHDVHPETLMLSEISRRLWVTGGNITGLVSRLEQAGYLARERDADDRRVIRARLTPAGEELYQTVMPQIQDRLRVLFGAIAPEEGQCVATACEKLHRSVASLRDADLSAAEDSA